MPGGNTKFQSSWLSAVDCNGQTVRDWCRRGKDDFHAYCRLCDNDFRCNNSGKSQILQHASGKVHKSLARPSQDQHQAKLVFTPKESSSPTPGTSKEQKSVLQLSVHRNDLLKAEGIWAAQVAAANYSFRSCEGIQKTFAEMFPDSKIAKDITLGRTKVSYLLSDGFGPYFRSELISDLSASDSDFSVHFDETTQAQVKKQMDIRIRYWSSLHDEVWCRFYTALFFGHAEGVKVADAIFNALKEDKAPLENLVALGMDGPNVNKTIFRELQSQLKTETSHHSGLINLGSCNIHVVHNSFGKGLDAYGKNTEQLCMDLYQLFKYSAARREDYKAVQLDMDVETHHFQRHTEVRWLSLGPSISRLLEQWDSILLFVKELGKYEKTTPKSTNFKRIQLALLTHPAETLLELLFLDTVFPLFSNFLLVFQTEAPMIHVLHDSMKDMLFKLMSRFIKPDAISSKDGEGLCKVDCKDEKNQLSDDEIVLGDKVREQLTKLKPELRKRELLSMRSFFIKATEYMKEKLPLSNKLLYSLRCLNPSNRLTDKAESVKQIQELARKLQPKADSVAIIDEWKCYLADDISCEIETRRIDHYWSDIFKLTNATGDPKYNMLKKVVKTALILPHGNADVERSLSVNVNVVTKERSQLGESVINGIRMTKDAVKFHDPELCRPEQIPFNRDVYVSLKNAHSVYMIRLESDREKKEERTRKRKLLEEEAKKIEEERQKLAAKRKRISTKEKELMDAEKEAKDSATAAGELIKQGQENLENVLKAKEIDRQKLTVAHMMIETASQKSGKALEQLEEIRGQQRKLELEKSSLFEKFQKKEEKDREKEVEQGKEKKKEKGKGKK